MYFRCLWSKELSWAYNLAVQMKPSGSLFMGLKISIILQYAEQYGVGHCTYEPRVLAMLLVLNAVESLVSVSWIVLAFV